MNFLPSSAYFPDCTFRMVLLCRQLSEWDCEGVAKNTEINDNKFLFSTYSFKIKVKQIPELLGNPDKKKLLLIYKFTVVNINSQKNNFIEYFLMSELLQKYTQDYFFFN